MARLPASFHGWRNDRIALKLALAAGGGYVFYVSIRPVSVPEADFAFLGDFRWAAAYRALALVWLLGSATLLILGFAHLRRRAGLQWWRARASRRPRWRPAFVLLAVAVPGLVAACGGVAARHGPGSGTLTGIVARCTPTQDKAGGWGPDPARVVTVSAQNQAGRTVASARLPLRTAGARYRMRLLAGSYSMSFSTGPDGSTASDFPVTVPAGQITEDDDFSNTGAGVCAG